jgi:hypothetical protein
MENGPEGFEREEIGKPAPAEIITGLERLWGKNLWCIPRLS